MIDIENLFMITQAKEVLLRIMKIRIWKRSETGIIYHPRFSHGEKSKLRKPYFLEEIAIIFLWKQTDFLSVKLIRLTFIIFEHVNEFCNFSF